MLRPKQSKNFLSIKLTWEGHEFLDAAREDTRWNKAKEVAAKTGSLTFSMLKEVLVQLSAEAWKKILLGG